MKKKENSGNICEIQIPEGEFCGHNCADGCIHWRASQKDSNGRQYCDYYGSYFYPRERQGCLSFE